MTAWPTLILYGCFAAHGVRNPRHMTADIGDEREPYMLQHDVHDVVVVGAGTAGPAATAALVAAGRDTVCWRFGTAVAGVCSARPPRPGLSIWGPPGSGTTGRGGSRNSSRGSAAHLHTTLINHEHQHDQWISEVRASDLGHALPSDPDSEFVRRIDGYLVVDVL